MDINHICRRRSSSCMCDIRRETYLVYSTTSAWVPLQCSFNKIIGKILQYCIFVNRYIWATMTTTIDKCIRKSQAQLHHCSYPDVQIYRIQGTRKECTYGHCRVIITSWLQDPRARCRWQNEGTLIPYIYHSDIDSDDDLRITSRRQGHPRKSCNLERIHYRSHEG